MNIKKISIIVPTKNSINTIHKCLESIINQRKNYIDVEIIVVDNFSTDGTEKYLHQLSIENTITYVKQGPERSEQRNIGIKLAHHEIIGYIDSDMYLSPDLLSEVLYFFEENNLDCVKVPEIILGTSWLAKTRRFERFLYCNSLIDSPRFIKRNIFEKIGYFMPGIPGAEDWELDSRIYKTSLKVRYFEKKLPTEYLIKKIEKNYQYYGLMHDETKISLKYLINKKNYYKEADLNLINTLLINKSNMIRVFSLNYRLKLLLKYRSLKIYNIQYCYVFLIIYYRFILLINNRLIRI